MANLPIAQPAAPLPPDRVLFAMLTGGAYGGLLVAAASAIGMIVVGAGAFAFWAGLMIFVIATPIWFIGIVIVGGPVWWVLHRLGLRSRRAASAAGGVVIFLVVGAFFSLKGNAPRGGDWFGVLAVAAPLAAIGAVVGWTVARSAYRRPESAE